MSVIDNKVVKMVFDNTAFEQGVSKTLGTLDKLKSALNFGSAVSGLSEATNRFNKMNFSGITNAIDEIGKKFTGLGAIAFGVFEEIGQWAGQKLLGVFSSLTSQINDLTIGQISSGWDKYAQKTTAVQTIMAATSSQFEDTGEQMEYVNSQLDKLNWFTDETSYNFVDMVGNIGKFTSVGQKLDNSVTAMIGIANWAAISGQNAATASRAMYNLSQAMGMGAVKLQDWRSIETASMNTREFNQTVLDTAVALGTLTKTSDNLYKTLKGNEVSIEKFTGAMSEGWFTSEVLMKTLDKYGAATNKLYELSEAADTTATDILSLVEANKKGSISTEDLVSAMGGSSTMTVDDFKKSIDELSSAEYEFGIKAFQAGQEAKTFADAVGSVKDAASTGWMNIFETIFGDYETARHIWTDFAGWLYEVFVTPIDKIRHVMNQWISYSDARDMLMETFADIPNLIGSYLNPLSTAFSKVFDPITGGDLYKGIFKVKSALESLTLGEGATESLTTIFSNLLTPIKSFGSIAGSAFKSLKPIGEVFKGFGSSTLGFFANSSEGIASFSEKFKEVIENTKIFNTISGKITDFLNKLAPILNSIKTFLQPISSFFGDIGNAIISYVPKLNEFIQNSTVLDTLADIINKIFKTLEPLSGVLNGVISKIGNSGIFKSIISVISEFGSVLQSALSNGVIPFFEKIIGYFTSFFSAEDEAGEKFFSFSNLVDKLSDAFSNLKDFLQPVTDGLKDFFITIKKSIDDFGVFGSIANGISIVFEKIKDAVVSALPTIQNAFGTIWEVIKNVIGNIPSYIGQIWDEIGGGKGILLGGIGIKQIVKAFKGRDGIGGIVDAIRESGGLVEKVKDFLTDFPGKLKKAGKAIGDGLGDLFGGITGAFQKSKIAEIADAMKSTALALGVLSLAILVLSNIDFGKAEGGILILAEALLAIGTALTIMSKFKFLTVKGLGAIGTAIAVVSVSMLALAGAMAIFAKVAGNETAWKGFGMMAASLGTISVIIGLLGIVGKFGGNKGMLTGAIAIGVVASSLIVLAAALAAFTFVSRMKDIEVGMLSLVAMLINVAGIIGLLAAIGKNNAAGLLSAATSIAVVSASLLVMAAALFAFTAIASLDHTAEAILSMIVILASVTGAIALLGKIGTENAAGMIIGAAAIAVVSVAMLGLAAAILALSLANPEHVMVSVLSLVVVLGAITIALAALSAVGPSVIVAAASLAIVSAALLGLSAAALIMGTALPLISVGLISLGSGILSISNSIGDSINALITSVGNGLTAFSSAIADSAVNISSAIITLGDGIGRVILSLSENIGSSIEIVLDSIGDGIVIFSANINDASIQLGSAISEFGEGIGTSIQNIGSGIGGFFDEIGNGISNGIAHIGSSIEEFGNSLGNIGNDIEQFGDGIRSLDGISWVDTSLGLLEISNSMKKLNKSAISSSCIQSVEDFANAINSFATIATSIENSVTIIYTSMNSIGNHMMTELIAGINSQTSVLINTVTNILNSARNIANNFQSSFRSIGSSLLSGLRNGMSNQQYGPSSVISSALNSARNTASGYYSSFVSVGSNIISGLRNGISSGSSSIASACSSVVSNALAAAKKAAKIGSPSKITQKYGEYLDEGWIVGMNRKSNEVRNSANEVTSIMISAMSRANSLMSSTFEDSEIGISPIINLNDVKNVTTSMNDIFSNVKGEAINAIDLANKIQQIRDNIQNDDLCKVIASLDQASINMLKENRDAPIEVRNHIAFEGSLSQLASIMHPAIVTESIRLGKNLTLQ